MGREQHVQRPECKELQDPRKERKVVSSLHGQRGRQMEQKGIA